MQIKKSNLSARHLVLSLLSAPGRPEGTIQRLIQAGAVFNIEASTIRVAIGRLVKDGMLISTERGVYALDASAKKFSQETRLWAQADKVTKPWTGKWVVIQTAHLGLTDKKKVCARERALRLYGFSKVMPGLWLRPENLILAGELLYNRLTSIGLEADAIMFEGVSNIISPRSDLLDLWSCREIEASYSACLDAMAQSLSSIPKLKLAEAAREAFLVGQAVIREINLDPLLPEGMIDTALRHKVVSQMRAYDEIGRDCWDKYFDQITN